MYIHIWAECPYRLRTQIRIGDEVPVHRCIGVSTRVIVSLHLCVDVSMYKCANVSMCPCIHVSMYQCIDASMRRWPCAISRAGIHTP